MGNNDVSSEKAKNSKKAVTFDIGEIEEAITRSFMVSDLFSGVGSKRNDIFAVLDVFRTDRLIRVMRYIHKGLNELIERILQAFDSLELTIDDTNNYSCFYPIIAARISIICAKSFILGFSEFSGIILKINLHRSQDRGCPEKSITVNSILVTD